MPEHRTYSDHIGFTNYHKTLLNEMGKIDNKKGHQSDWCPEKTACVDSLERGRLAIKFRNKTRVSIR